MPPCLCFHSGHQPGPHLVQDGLDGKLGGGGLLKSQSLGPLVSVRPLALVVGRDLLHVVPTGGGSAGDHLRPVSPPVLPNGVAQAPDRYGCTHASRPSPDGPCRLPLVPATAPTRGKGSLPGRTTGRLPPATAQCPHELCTVYASHSLVFTKDLACISADENLLIGSKAERHLQPGLVGASL